MHVRFVVAAASLRARQVGLPFDGDDFDDQAKVLIASVETGGEEGGGGGGTADYDAALEALLENTPRPDAHFERLPDRKHPETADRRATARYLAFLVATSSLRALCFDIQPESPYRTSAGVTKWIRWVVLRLDIVVVSQEFRAFRCLYSLALRLVFPTVPVFWARDRLHTTTCTCTHKHKRILTRNCVEQ